MEADNLITVLSIVLSAVGVTVVILTRMHVTLTAMERRLTDRIGALEVGQGRLDERLKERTRAIESRIDRMDARLEGRPAPDRADPVHA